MARLDDAAFGFANEVTPKFISPADPAARWTGAHGGQAFFAYSDNYLIDLDHGIIVDVEPSTALLYRASKHDCQACVLKPPRHRASHSGVRQVQARR